MTYIEVQSATGLCIYVSIGKYLPDSPSIQEYVLLSTAMTLPEVEIRQ